MLFPWISMKVVGKTGIEKTYFIRLGLIIYAVPYFCLITWATKSNILTRLLNYCLAWKVPCQTNKTNNPSYRSLYYLLFSFLSLFCLMSLRRKINGRLWKRITPKLFTLLKFHPGFASAVVRWGSRKVRILERVCCLSQYYIYIYT